MGKLMSHIFEQNVDSRFGLLPEMCRSSPCQLGALTSESFSERMISAANLFLTDHRIHLEHETIHKCVVLRMNKEFMARKREKKASTAVVYEGVLAENDGNWSMEI